MDSFTQSRYSGEQEEKFLHSDLQAQLDFLRRELSPQSLPDLLLLCSELADSAPILFLVEEAQSRGITLEESLGEVLLRLSTSSLHKLLTLPGLENPVKKAWTRATVEELVSFALLDRYLRRRAPELWTDCLKRVVHLTRDKLQSGAPPDERLTLRLQGSEQKRLRTEYAEAWTPWSEAWEETAKKAIQILAKRPRGVSLANAERLLSQQVYTDQGHFLLELLQNADDAGASFFEVQFQNDAVVVSHNGVPFDFRDLVGVLSIGQTTKTERQIGYFGVGFKSVFEVTERPKIFSGNFAFEIIDISVPRYLSAAENDPDRTTLHLPLKEGLSIEPYYQRALEIEATLLLNLPNVRLLRWIGPDGKVTELSQSQNKNLHTLTRTVSSGEAAKVDFLVWKGRYNHKGERPEGKPQEAQVMLAFPQNSDGDSIPGGNLYSFLPIQEDSGLRFLIGSHFDVPVDRERLDQTSRWNRGILRAVPDVIEAYCKQEPRALLPLLKLLPLPEDRVGPLFRLLSPALAQKLKRTAFLPRRGEFVTAEEATLLDQQLAPLFQEEELKYFVQPEDDRTRAWLQQLGARSFELKSLLGQIVKGKVPRRLLNKDVAAWQLFHKLLLQDPSFETWEGHLKTVPLLLNQHGEMAAANELVLLSPEWGSVFHTPPPTLWSELRSLPETNTLVASLEIRHFDWPDLLSNLSRNGFDHVNADALFRLLLSAPKQVQLACLQLPLYSSSSESGLPLTAPGSEQKGLCVAVPDTPQQLFPGLRFCTQVEMLEPLLEAVGWPWFDRARALAYLQKNQWKPDEQQAESLGRWILSRPPDWATLEDLERLASLPIFKSRAGTLRPLHELWQYEDPELEGLMPDLPQLCTEEISGQLVAHFGLHHLLGQANLGTLIDSLERHDQQASLNFLASRAEQLSRQQISKLLRKPLYQGQSVSHPDHPAGRGVVEVAEPDLVELFLKLGVPVASVDFSRSIVPLLEAAGFKPLGLKRLVEVLQQTTPAPELVPEIHRYFIENALDLHIAHSEEILQSLPIWLCRDGRVRAASKIPPDEDLAELLDKGGHLPLDNPPETLSELIPFLDPGEFLLNEIATNVAPRRPLSEQPSWLSSVEKVDSVAQFLPLHQLAVDLRGVLAEDRLLYAPPESHRWLKDSALAQKLLHRESSDWQIQRARHLPARTVLEGYLTSREDPESRQAFYQYLHNHLGQIVREEKARAWLLAQPIWLNSANQWNRLDQLVLDGALPELGYDWSPHPEIPAELLEQLKATLDVGRSDPESLLKNLMRSYQEKVEAGLPGSEVLWGMAKLSESLSSEQVQAASPWPGLSFPIYQKSDRAYRDVAQSYAPPEHLAALAAVPPEETALLGLLRKLGLPYFPSPERLTNAAPLSEKDAEALEELIAWSWDERPAEVTTALPFLRNFNWVLNRDGELKAPIQLYLPSNEVEELVGNSPALYPAHTRPFKLWRSLGVRDESQVSFGAVLKNLKNKIADGQRVGSRFYSYLEQSLQNETIASDFLLNSLRDVPWVWTDEGEYRTPDQVLGVPGYRYFGSLRGTWERAPKLYPRLTSLFQIPAGLSPEVILRFLQQVATGSITPPSTRLIRNGLAYLSESNALVPREWKILPARQLPEGRETLVAALQQGVVRSNSPTLAAMFGAGGTLWVVETEDPEHGQALETLYDRLAIPKLRDSYTVHTDDSGSDMTQELGDSVSDFRRLLAALYDVLPRLQAARPDLNEGEWLADTHLKPFAATAPIRVIDGLRLVYTLEGVSSVTVMASLAYDPEKKRLLVSASAVQEPQRYAVALAEGLVDCIYQGPGSENLIDLLNLLLLFGNETSMNSYLDQRHFPRPFVEQSAGAEPWRKRLGEILDYGLQKVLQRRYEELLQADWDRWRETDWSPDKVTVEELLKQIGVVSPTPGLVAELKLMVESPELRIPSTTSTEETAHAQEQDEASIPRAVPEPKPEPQNAFSVAKLGKRLFSRLNDWLAKEPAEDPVLRLNSPSQNLDLAQHYQHPPRRHLLVSGRNLTGHNLYCLNHLCSDFDPRNQEYRPGWKNWHQLFLPIGETLQFSGSYGASSFPLPRPLYSRLSLKPEGQLSGPDEFQQYRLEPEDLDAKLHYEVELCGIPNYQSGTYLPEPGQALLKPTVAIDQLPQPVQDWIDWGQCSGLPHWQLAERAREYVAGAYQYDLNYLTAPEAQAVLKRAPRAGENKFLSVLHAGGAGRILGRGVCVELSAILLEILRHCGAPSAIAKVWMLDQGLIHIPDHVIVVALVPTEYGPYWLPLDPSGQRIVAEQSEPERPLTRLELLEKAAALLLRDRVPSLPEVPGERQELLHKELLALFGDSNLMEVFLECLAKPGRYRKELTPEFEELQARGFIDVNPEQLFQIWIRKS